MNPSINETRPTGAAPRLRACGGGLLQPLCAGLLPAVVLAWTLLSVALSLPFMLGLFFFMLFGLVIGATMYRFGRSSRPVSRAKVVVMTALVSAVCWSVAVYKEGLEFPEDFVSAAVRGRRLYIPKDGHEQVRAQLHDFIVEYLRTNHPPGGVLGYLKLAGAGRPIELDLPGQPRSITIAPRAAAWVWWTRVLLSLVLLYAAVHSVTSGLGKADEQKRRTGKSAGH